MIKERSWGDQKATKSQPSGNQVATKSQPSRNHAWCYQGAKDDPGATKGRPKGDPGATDLGRLSGDGTELVAIVVLDETRICEGGGGGIVGKAWGWGRE